MSHLHLVVCILLMRKGHFIMARTCTAVTVVSDTVPLPALALFAWRGYGAEQRGAQASVHAKGGCPRLVVAVPVCGDCGKALEKDDPCISRAVVPAEVQSVVDWMAQVSEDEEMDFRAVAIAGIEAEGAALWKAGQCSKWLANCEVNVARVSRNTNGPLIEALCARAGHVDGRCADLLCRGAWGCSMAIAAALTGQSSCQVRSCMASWNLAALVSRSVGTRWPRTVVMRSCRRKRCGLIACGVTWPS